jgi:hypothetical protein
MWLRATCQADHAQPVPTGGCSCGVYGWHPTHRTARRVLAVRREIAGLGAAALEGLLGRPVVRESRFRVPWRRLR